MAKKYNQALAFWRDAAGVEATSWVTAADQVTEPPAGVQALTSAMAALSNAALVGCAWQAAKTLENEPGSGAYPSVQDIALFQLYYDGVRKPVGCGVPAPKDGIWLPGNVLVDMSNADVAAFVAQLLAVAGDSEGRPVVSVGQGRRSWITR